MSLEQEIAICQFGQGIVSNAELLDQLSQLDADEKRRRVLDLVSLVGQFKPVDSDSEQAMAANAIKATDMPFVIVYIHRLKKGLRIALAEGELVHSYSLLLDVFKKAYQRRVESGGKNSTNWRFWDLSSPEITHTIRTRQDALVEELYNTPSFRSEFASIAKLWYENRMLTQAQIQEPAPEPQTHFTFLTYDEMLAESIKLTDNKHKHALFVLLQSVEKALSIRYGLDPEQASKVALAVMERHLQATYHTGLF